MKELTKMMVVGAMALGIVSCKKSVTGEGPSVTQPRTVSNFDAIDLRMAGNVYYKNAPAWKLEVTAQQNILNMLQTYVSDNKLVIKFTGSADYHSSSPISINVTGPGVNTFRLTTAGSIYCTNTVQVSTLFLSVRGSGKLSMQNVTAGAIEATNEGSGTITASGGNTINENLKTSGSGKIDLAGIVAKTVTAKTSGSGSIILRSTDHLDATVEGSGSIYFSGNPTVSSHIYGSGHLIHY